MPVIGFLSSSAPFDRARYLNAFHQGLREAGYVEGQNVAIEYRWAQDQADRLPAIATMHLMKLNDRYKLTRWGQLDFIDGVRPLTAIDEAGFNFLNYLTGELALYRKQPSRVAEHSFTLMGRLLQSFLELSIQDGFHFGVVLIPTSSTLAGAVEMYQYPKAVQRTGGYNDQN
jgi:hypothetical protein